MSGEGAKASTILEKLDPMTVIGSAIVRMPGYNDVLVTMIVRCLVTMIGSTRDHYNDGDGLAQRRHLVRIRVRVQVRVRVRVRVSGSGSCSR